MARLEALTGAPLQRIGLSATVSPIEDVARFLSDQAHMFKSGIAARWTSLSKFLATS